MAFVWHLNQYWTTESAYCAEQFLCNYMLVSIQSWAFVAAWHQWDIKKDNSTQCDNLVPGYCCISTVIRPPSSCRILVLGTYVTTAISIMVNISIRLLGWVMFVCQWVGWPLQRSWSRGIRPQHWHFPWTAFGQSVIVPYGKRMVAWQSWYPRIETQTSVPLVYVEIDAGKLWCDTPKSLWWRMLILVK